MTDRLFPDDRICATFPAMTLLTKQERWVLLAFLALIITGLLGKAWLAARPPEPLPPLPTAPSAGTAR